MITSKWMIGKNFIKRLNRVVKQHGALELIARIMRRIFSVPVALLIVCIYPIVKIRLIQLYSSRIGHFVVNTHLLLCALALEDFPEEKNCIHLYYLQTSLPICNRFFYKMCSRALFILPSWGEFWGLVNQLLIFFLKEKYHTPFKKMFESTVGGHDERNYYKRCKKQFFSFTDKEKQLGEQLKIQLGIPAGAKYICLLVRDSRYLQQTITHGGWSAQDFRNADINSYIEAIEYLTQNNIYVLRMGKIAGSPLEINNAKFIDYAYHPLKSDFLDIYLSAHCFFFISTSCGIDSVAKVFHRPLLTTNVILQDIETTGNCTFTLPKKFMHERDRKFVSYREVFDDHENLQHSGRYIQMDQYWKQQKNWLIVDNTPDEILSATREILMLLSGQYCETTEMKTEQKRFWKNLPFPLPLGERSYENIKLRIPHYFLEKYHYLFD